MSKDLGAKAIRISSVALSLSLVILAHERVLTPLYGSGPTSYLLDKMALGAAVASALHPIKVSTTRNLLYTALALTLAPNATYWIGVWTSRRKDPLWGPAITHATTLGPLTFMLTTFATQMADTNEVKPSLSMTQPALVLRLLRAAVTYLISILLAHRVWSTKPIFFNISENQIYLVLAGLAYNLWIIAASFTRKSHSSKEKKQNVTSFTEIQSKVGILMAFNALWWSIYPRFGNPILPHPLLKTYPHPTYPLNVLSAEQSVTGLITVADWLPPPENEKENHQGMHSARYIRASHSLLGGVWTHDNVQILDNEEPLRDSFGTPLGDSIYSTFIIQEAVRMVNSTKTSKAWGNGLIIGLGAGISATSFARHGINTTIVEIDPAVYKAARTYFGLPDPGPGNVFLEDARRWTAQRRASIEAGSNQPMFDFVVHDCFSGGGVPEHIFTTEFWEDLKVSMKSDGVLVVNYAGYAKSRSSGLVINTLEKSFGTCRAFHDLFNPLPEENYDTDFINMIIFCTRDPSPLTFRESRRSDWLGSPLRRHVLQSMETREVNLELIRGSPDGDLEILTDLNNPLGAMEKKQGNHHWIVMRGVLPDIHWETY